MTKGDTVKNYTIFDQVESATSLSAVVIAVVKEKPASKFEELLTGFEILLRNIYSAINRK